MRNLGGKEVRSETIAKLKPPFTSILLPTTIAQLENEPLFYY